MNYATNINPLILIWARKTAGLSLGEAAKKIGLSTSEKSSAGVKLAAIESGDKFPTRKQLAKISNIYRRPLTVFYLQEPPPAGKPVEDFRTGNEFVSERENALLKALIRDTRARQSMVRAILEDDKDYRALEFVSSISVHTPVVDAVRKITSALEFEPYKPRKGYRSADNLFKFLRTRTQALGVFVLLFGNLGSYHSKIDDRVFRGFAISDKMAPFIVINDQDSRAARSFTLIHELCHIFLGNTSVSGTPNIDHIDNVERFCNYVAGEVLLPSDVLGGFDVFQSKDQASEMVSALAQEYLVSEPLVTYKFHQLGKIRRRWWHEMSAMYAVRWKSQCLKNSKANQNKQISYDTIQRYRLGNALVQFVGQNLRNYELTHTKAAHLLGVKPTAVERLLKGAVNVSGHSKSGGS